ncbi:hypothetical protein ACTQ2Q_10080 [Atopobiaceae bacterium LCP21S3_F11]
MSRISDQITGTCDGGDCNRQAVSLGYDERISGLIPVCRRHITAYRVEDGHLWQAEDEFAGLRFCRRSRWRWLAQRRLLKDQRAAMRGGISRYQLGRWLAESEAWIRDQVRAHWQGQP